MTFPVPLCEHIPEHLEDLKKSGITREAAKAAGIFSLSPDLLGKALALCGFSDGGTVKSAMVIPDYTNGIPQFKLFPPIRGKSEKPIKYLVPKGSNNHFWFAPGSEPKNGERLLFTEGRKKALALTLAGFFSVALVGVWSFLGKNGDGKTSPLADFDTIPWEGREVEIVFDSDAGTNANVFEAEQALATELTQRGAKVSIVRLPMAPDGSKQGADDFLVAQGPEAFAPLPRTPFKSNQAAKEDRKKKKQEKKKRPRLLFLPATPQLMTLK